jgi:hypothetical protein
LENEYLSEDIHENIALYQKKVYSMTWTVSFTNKAAKQVKKLPDREKDTLIALVRDLQLTGAAQPEWPNYSKLGGNRHHCHLSHKWVACWTLEDEELKLIEVYYAGSRGSAPY